MEPGAKEVQRVHQRPVMFSAQDINSQASKSVLGANVAQYINSREQMALRADIDFDSIRANLKQHWDTVKTLGPLTPEASGNPLSHVTMTCMNPVTNLLDDPIKTLNPCGT